MSLLLSSQAESVLPPLPENRVVVGCGSLSVDYLATVAAFPKPDDKIRSTSLKVESGGNTGNALTCAARLGLKSRLISKLYAKECLQRKCFLLPVKWLRLHAGLWVQGEAYPGVQILVCFHFGTKFHN